MATLMPLPGPEHELSDTAVKGHGFIRAAGDPPCNFQGLQPLKDGRV